MTAKASRTFDLLIGWSCFTWLAFWILQIGLLAETVPAQTVMTPNVLRLNDGASSPPAQVQDMHWIAGSWRGQALGGTFEETWNSPSGDSMLGLFKLVLDGKTQFSEIMAIVPQGESIVLKLKHFHADLRGWEEQDKTVDFPLVKLNPDEACFQGLTFRRIGPDRMTIYVAMKRGSEVSELEFPAQRVESPTVSHTAAVDHLSQAGGVNASGEAGLSEEVRSEIEAYIQKVRSDWDVPGLAVAVVQGDRVLMAGGYGVRRLDSQEAVDADTQFAIASNSKAFTAAAVGILMDEGKLDWDDPVIKHLPTFQMPDPWTTREMTVRDLLSHRSGMDTFSGDLLWYDSTYSADEIVHRIRYLKPTSSFRSRYGYQNLMYIAAGKVIEKVSGQSWADFVRSRILEPAGMLRTTTSVTQLHENFASPHNRSGGDGLRILPLGNVDNSWGACGLNSSVNDLARWMQLQMAGGEYQGKRIISNQRLFEMWQPSMIQTLTPASIANEPTRNFQAYGLGYALNDWHGKKIVSHSGGLDGMISQLAMVPSEKLGVVVLTNSESGASRFIRDRILECLLGVEDRKDKSAEAVSRLAAADQVDAQTRDKLDAERRTGTQPTIPLADFASTYQSQLYGDVAISLDQDRLVMRLGPAPNFVADLEHWHLNTFQIHWRDSVKYNFPRGFVNFTLDAAGRPKQLVIDQPNDDFWFYELELFRKED